MGPAVAELKGNHWTDRRLQIHEWLGNQRESLAELYCSAVNMLEGNATIPGRSRFIAHSVREIRNRLPDATVGPRSGEYFDYHDHLDNLQKTWEKHLPIEGNVRIEMVEETPSMPEHHIPFPRPVAEDVADIIRRFHRAGETKRETARRMFAELGDNELTSNGVDPVVARWLEVTEWFTDRAHDGNKTDDEHDWDRYTENFERFEGHLASLSGRFSETLSDLDDELERANA